MSRATGETVCVCLRSCTLPGTNLINESTCFLFSLPNWAPFSQWSVPSTAVLLTLVVGTQGSCLWECPFASAGHTVLTGCGQRRWSSLQKHKKPRVKPMVTSNHTNNILPNRCPTNGTLPGSCWSRMEHRPFVACRWPSSFVVVVDDDRSIACHRTAEAYPLWAVAVWVDSTCSRCTIVER